MVLYHMGGQIDLIWIKSISKTFIALPAQRSLRLELLMHSFLEEELETLGGAHMKSIAIYAAVLSGFGALMLMGTVATTVPAAAKCMIDEGNGRYTPCEAFYSAAKPQKC